MKYAITCEHNDVFQHFGKTPSFLIVEIKDGVANKTLVSTNGKGHGALSGFLQEYQVEVLVCGGIGQGAKDALAAAHIEIISGAKGNCDDIVKSLLAGTLKDNPNGMCHHYDGETHHCGSHNC